MILPFEVVLWKTTARRFSHAAHLAQIWRDTRQEVIVFYIKFSTFNILFFSISQYTYFVNADIHQTG